MLHGQPAPAVTIDQLPSLKLTWAEFCSVYSNGNDWVNMDDPTYFRIHVGFQSLTPEQIRAHLLEKHKTWISTDILQAENCDEIGFMYGIPVISSLPLRPFSNQLSKSMGMPVYITRSLMLGTIFTRWK
jgi:hypothetical protein